MGRLEGKTALVTAAGQGIGKACAELFTAEGADVLATDINAEALSALTVKRTALLDVTDAEAITHLTAETGAVDILCNIAGFVHAGTIMDCDETAWARSMDINVTAMYRMIRAFLPAMLANGGGSIVNMSSVASSVTSAPNRFAYGTTKAAVIGLTKALAADYVTQGIRANAICPGTVETPSLQQRLRDTGDYDKAYREFCARQPMGRLGKPEEIAELALYLASDAAAFTTGTINVIDGGWSM